MSNDSELKKEALAMHSSIPSGKIAVQLTKPLMTQYDLSLAYTPGVAAPCLEIEKNVEASFDYTARGNFVAVITNGTAVLGLGNIGAAAAKPVMEGKAALFKRFADIDAVDVEVDTADPERFIEAVRYLGPSWGGINLEDIKAPECFIIERRLKEYMDIPVFHDDQHGTAVVSAAGLINAAQITGRNIGDIKLVVNGAGAAAIACVNLMVTLGVAHENIIMCDRSGIIYVGRETGMNEWKSHYAANTKCRTLADAMVGADMFLGLSSKGALSKEMVATMQKNPIIFAMANPDPEITPEEVYTVRQDAIIATGRSDYKNQINNVMGFPYIFRGALDVRATQINEEMKIAAAHALAKLAQLHVPQELSTYYGGQQFEFGPQYIVPLPFDRRLIYVVSCAVAKAAMESGVARKPIDDFRHYERSLEARVAHYGSIDLKPRSFVNC